MTKQEEIHGVIIGGISEVFEELDHWDCSTECGHKVCLIEWREEVANKILSHLHNSGVVIKKEGELPKYSSGRAVDTWIAIERLWYEKAQQDMLKAGYTLTKPIWEKK